MRAAASLSAAHVLVVDSNRARRRLIATAFRAAGCVVVEIGQEHEVTKVLAAANAKPWVMAVAGSMLTTAFCDRYPAVPVVRLGVDHENMIAGRFSVGPSSDLAPRLHALVAARGGFN